MFISQSEKIKNNSSISLGTFEMRLLIKDDDFI